MILRLTLLWAAALLEKSTKPKEPEKETIIIDAFIEDEAYLALAREHLINIATEAAEGRAGEYSTHIEYDEWRGGFTLVVKMDVVAP